jgi:hypothetical protein
MRDPTGKIRWSTKMTPEEMLNCTPFPCGICLHCKINKRRVWTFRLLLEQRVTEKSCFITLTYSPDFLPKDKSVHKSHLQKYLKRLRKKTTQKIRYYAVGEYGDKSWRPHYHIALFGLNSEDSKIISSSWKDPKTKQDIGFVQIGDLNKDSASYIVGYVIKKLTNKKDERLNGLLPEFMTSSRGKTGGIGLPYIKKLAQRINKFKYKENRIITEIYYNGRLHPLGSYLTKKLAELTDIPEEFYEQKYLDYMDSIYGNQPDPEDSYWQKQFADDTKMHSAEVKHNIFKQRRTI